VSASNRGGRICLPPKKPTPVIFQAPAIPALLLLAGVARASDPEGPPGLEPGWSEPALQTEQTALRQQLDQALCGQPPGADLLAASVELNQLQQSELRFLNLATGRGLLGALAWYRDPLGLLTADPLQLARVDAEEFDLPIVINDDVELWMRYFLGRGREWYGRWLARSSRYRPMIAAGLAKRGMPADLFYLCMIESGFSTRAHSSASAVGLWQFVAPTAQAYGLRVDWWVDERRDPERSTAAALRHLQDLHGMFGDWYTAAAAYNAGAGRIRRAIARTGAQDYWSLAQPGNLPPETRAYVPKLIAAAILGHYPERYSFGDVAYQAPSRIEHAEAPAGLALSSLARCAGLDEQTFRELNPALRRWALPPQPTTQQLRIPVGRSSFFEACLARIPSSEKTEFRRHRVLAGESLSEVAAIYGVGASSIARVNQLEPNGAIYVGNELIIPTGALPDDLVSPSREDDQGALTHTVRRGENLAGIAARYAVSLDDLLTWNPIADPDRIQAGQRLRIQGAAPAAVMPIEHTVARGDTLSALASQYGVTVAELQRWNGIADPAHLRIGQRLALYTDSSGWTAYTVQRGDTLGSIARRYGCAVAEIKTWNGLKSNTIHPGQKLRIQR